MKIECLFIVRDERSSPELLTAWDEYTISENADAKPRWNQCAEII